MSDSLGARFARAIADKNEPALRGLLADDVDFKGLTPGRLWEGVGPDAVVETLFGSWFEPSDEVVAVGHVTDGEAVGDTERVSYRFDLRNDAGDQVAEQQAYYRPADADRIGYLRVLCSGFRPR
jgi:hypothetical protein